MYRNPILWYDEIVRIFIVHNFSLMISPFSYDEGNRVSEERECEVELKIIKMSSVVWGLFVVR
jgi:hypothetical protein